MRQEHPDATAAQDLKGRKDHTGRPGMEPVVVEALRDEQVRTVRRARPERVGLQENPADKEPLERPVRAALLELPALVDQRALSDQEAGPALLDRVAQRAPQVLLDPRELPEPLDRAVRPVRLAPAGALELLAAAARQEKTGRTVRLEAAGIEARLV